MTDTLQFGIGFENADARRQIEYARLAEELGFAACWVPEDYFFRGAFTIASALACSTSRIRIGLGVVNPFTRHPALIAMEFAALTELAPARTILGIGAGVKVWIDQMGIGSPTPGAAIEEAVEVIRRLLRGEKVTFAGKVFHTDQIGLSFKSPQAEIPIYLGVLGARNLAMAGRIADGVMLSALTSPAYARFAAEKIHAAAQSAGRTGKLKLGAFLLTSISEDERAAREALKPLLAAMISLIAAQPPTPLLTEAGMDPDELRRFAETYAGGELPVRLVTDSIIDTFAIAGGPDRCAAALQKIRDAGVTHPVFFETPGIPAEKTIRAVHQYLMPRFL
ncbi:MAG TPA: LLM class flavin-dependent oxidoreductase [Candidatus Binataceae bacterium]|nr:LLM class flavin-dependent oxidoreductase [Candidatus Binataceae bacterium]